eukprot:Rhum_TRINITY_DN2901_c0_g1::Rhum_TRINITY_DN2901_c0_g1_i1::g.8792::m.8792
MRRLLLPTVVLFALLLCVLCVGVASGDEHFEPYEGSDDTGPSIPGLSAADGSGIPLHVGRKMKLDHMGPLVIQKDGTTKRVTNWHKMTKGEQEAAYDRITRRNRERLDSLKKKQEGDAARDAGAHDDL